MPVDGLTLLGKASSRYPEKPDASTVETFPNRNANQAYWIRFSTSEFTSVCPVTGQPDFAEITIAYVPGEKCIETKSLKFYLASYRNERSFNEEIVNRICRDLVTACAPVKMHVHGAFGARGGIEVYVDSYYPADELPDQI